MYLVSSILEGTKRSALLTDRQNVAKGMGERVCEPQHRYTAPGQKVGIDWAYEKQNAIIQIICTYKFTFLI